MVRSWQAPNSLGCLEHMPGGLEKQRVVSQDQLSFNQFKVWGPPLVDARTDRPEIQQQWCSCPPDLRCQAWRYRNDENTCEMAPRLSQQRGDSGSMLTWHLIDVYVRVGIVKCIHWNPEHISYHICCVFSVPHANWVFCNISTICITVLRGRMLWLCSCLILRSVYVLRAEHLPIPLSL